MPIVRPRCSIGNQRAAIFTVGGQPPAWNHPLTKASAIITFAASTPGTDGASTKSIVTTAEPSMPTPRMRFAPKRSVSWPLKNCPTA